MGKTPKKSTENRMVYKELTCMNGYMELFEITHSDLSMSYRIEVLIGNTEIMNDDLDTEAEAILAFYTFLKIINNFKPM